MILDQKEISKIISIFKTQGLSTRGACSLVSTLSRWEKAYGIKWVVTRLKLVKSNLLAGKAEGIRSHPDGTFWGPLGQISKLYAKNRHGSIRALRIVSIYGRWEHPTATEEDYKVFQSAINDSPKNTFTGELKLSSSDRRLARMAFQMSRFDLNLQISNKRVPFLGSLEKDTLPIDHYLVLTEQCPNLLIKHLNMFTSNGIIDLDLLNEGSTGGAFSSEFHSLEHDVAGNIVGLTADRGMKLRFIANPHRFLQMGTSRLKSALSQYLKSLPESLVFNQDTGIDWVRNELRSGKQMSSLDLSSATDHFPRDYQVKLLTELFPGLSSDISLWEDVSSLIWESPSGETDIRYLKGQPMGTGPSFSAFTVSHLHLVRSLGGNIDNFRIIGDDIVISDPLLTERYQEAMSQLGVRINLTKSLLNSKDKAEFAGRIIDKHGHWPVFKASKMSISKDPFGYLRQYGSAALSLYPNKVRELVRLVSVLPGIGPTHIQKIDLDDLDPSVVYTIYMTKPEMFGTYNVPPSWSLFSRPTNVFEESGFFHFLGNIGVKNSPSLVEHVNAQLDYELRDNDFIRSLILELETAPGSEIHGKAVYSLSYVKKVAALISCN